MSDPMKIRAQMKGDIADIRVLISHPMETGLRKDPKTGKNVPAHYIKKLSVTVNGKTVVDGETGTSISRNPVFGFKVKGAKAGDKITISWEDNKGNKDTADDTVK